jgi:hypothetical protein
MNLIINPAQSDTINKLLASPSQALLLTGNTGVGLYTIASHIIDGHPSITIKPTLAAQNSSMPQIDIATIRSLYSRLSTKNNARRYVIIDDADKMTIPAQNSLLKLLEEPSDFVSFVLTSHNPERLIATVKSRLQHIFIQNCTSQQTNKVLDTAVELSDTERQQLAFVASGLPAELNRCISDKSYRDDTIQSTVTAKTLLEGDVAYRSSMISKLPNNRADALALLDKMILLISRRPHKQSIKLLHRLLECQKCIQLNCNIRLQLLEAMV